MPAPLLPNLNKTVDQLVSEFDRIPQERKVVLNRLTQFIRDRSSQHQPVLLNFICTHNSRRSHMAQLWALAAAHYFGISKVFCYSGGTEATAFNIRAVKALRDVGFAITTAESGANPVYEVRFADGVPPVISFSKKYDDPFNHQNDFAAVMTCSQADENCPVVTGAVTRIALTYEDPKAFDDTPQESGAYAERVHQIGREILYAFSEVATG